MILVAYRHGLRAAELVSLEWAQVDFATGTMHVRRVKQAPLACIRSEAMSYAPCGSSNGKLSIALRIPVGAWGTVHNCRLRAPNRACRCCCEAVSGQASSAHAPSRLRVRFSERWPRHTLTPSVSRPQEHSAHREIHRTRA